MDIIKFLQPVNLESEREKFLASNRYQPQFAYDWDTPLVTGWLDRSPRYRRLVEATYLQDHMVMVAEAERLFQTRLERRVFAKARGIIDRGIVAVDPPTLEEVVKTQQKVIDDLGLGYVVVVSREAGFNARPEHGKKRLLVSQSINFEMFSLESSVRHDMVHLIRRVNGEVNGIKRSEEYLPTEEGLASYCQDLGGSESNNSYFQHAAEYLVTEVMLYGSFQDGYTYLRDLGFSQELAWQRAVRHKYGWKDTRHAGDIMKPAMYFAWEEVLRALTDEERVRLFCGKISIDQLADYPNYQGVVREEKLRGLLGMS